MIDPTFDIAKLMSGELKMEHPCDWWAKQQGFQNWRAVVAHCDREVLVVKTVHFRDTGKSDLGIKMFVDQVAKDGLTFWPYEYVTYLGKHEQFPEIVKQEIKKVGEEFVARYPFLSPKESL